jgi:hypothetical protein
LTNGRPHAPADVEAASVAHLPLSYARGDAACVLDLGGGARIESGSPGDHPLVLQLLVEARQAALGEDFQSRLDEPSYRPSDRLLVRRDQALVAHVHLASCIGWFENQRVPLVKLQDFATLPEFARAGYDDELVRSAESIATGEGAILAVVHAEAPDVFLRHGWSLLRGQGHTRASARAVLAHLDAQEATRWRRRRPGVQVRTWRHFELDAIRQVYEQAAPPLWGPLLRSEAAWQWLVARKAQDQILLAAPSNKASSEIAELGDDGADRIVGYAAIRGSCIAEMMTLEGCDAARAQLLARACRDAIDRDHHYISLYTPAADSLHELLVTAGGAWISDASAGAPRWLVKLLGPEKWVERLYPAWHDRARQCSVPRPFELGLVAGDERYRFTLTRRSSRLERNAELPAAWVEGPAAIAESLLLGNLSIASAVTRGELRLSQPELAGPLAAIFAPRLFWQSPLELMRV